MRSVSRLPITAAELYCPTMRSKQQNLFESSKRKRYARRSHGGDSTGQRKLERPLSTRDWIHLILKSDKARGKMSLRSPQHQTWIEHLLREKARKFGVRIADLSNVGTHLHIKIRIASREAFQKFLKSITTLIARKVTGARRGRPFGRFWSGLAFSRVLKSRLEEFRLRGYFEANRREANQSYAARERYLERFHAWVRTRVTNTC